VRALTVQRHVWHELLLALLLAFWTCSFARAQALNATPAEPSPEALAAARSLFNEGVQGIDAKQWALAEDRFQRVLEIKWSPVAAYNLASVQMELGKLISASDVLHKIARDPSAEAQARVAAEQLLGELEKRIGHITLKVSGPMTDAEVFIDARPWPRAALDIAAPMDPGTHRVSVNVHGTEVDAKEISVGNGAPLEISVELRTAAPPPPPVAVARAAPLATATNFATAAHDSSDPVATKPSAAITKRWWFWAGSAVVVAAGASLAVMMLSKDATRMADPIQGNVDPSVLHGTVVAP
jgi:hypothetical protein